MKSITVSLRVRPEHLAKALDGLLQYDKSHLPETLAEIVRSTMFIGINQTTIGLPLEASQSSMDTILGMTRQRGKKRTMMEPYDMLRSNKNEVKQDIMASNIDRAIEHELASMTDQSNDNLSSSHADDSFNPSNLGDDNDN